MAVPKSERLLNLLIMLLVQRRPIGKDRIRGLLYAGSSPEAFEKMFERDKDELRSLGVPVEVAPLDPLFSDEVGYRIPPDAFALPDVALTPQEAAVVGIASRVWQHATMAQVTSDAVRKLTAAGIDVDLDALDITGPLLTADEPAFDACWFAVCERVEIAFDYRRPGADAPTTRHLQPWGVVRSAGRWYVVGHDVDRGAERVFRLSRVVGPVRTASTPGAYEVPADVDLRAITRRLDPPARTEHATLLVRAGAGHLFRRDAERVQPGVEGPDAHSVWDLVEVRRRSESLVEEVLAEGPDVVLLAPEHARQQVRHSLEQVLVDT
ncbi:WYL domain-containing protein [Nocardioides sp. zg-536]|uniref:WYL domain-containing protein n=1 Tax=Nocardioides faecalis TaxID=2803858 RepID=A0A938Y7S8_9ACTN|nr:WYL domain-containing protein [Nocardioides faecalis]MBM9459066.1 WYL domain-containing protein [Nocardioides faecalis]QVI57329.1 WYL domain-containing protein [Nocardioides faecalis]